MRPPQGLRRNLGKPDLADLSGRHQGRHGANRLLDRHRRVAPVTVIEVDLLDAQALQGGVASLLDVVRAVVDTPLILAGFADDTELGGQHHLPPSFRAALADELAEQAFVVAQPVGVGAVEEVDAEIERRRQRL